MAANIEDLRFNLTTLQRVLPRLVGTDTFDITTIREKLAPFLLDPTEKTFARYGIYASEIDEIRNALRDADAVASYFNNLKPEDTFVGYAQSEFAAGSDQAKNVAEAIDFATQATELATPEGRQEARRQVATGVGGEVTRTRAEPTGPAVVPVGERAKPATTPRPAPEADEETVGGRKPDLTGSELEARYGAGASYEGGEGREIIALRSGKRIYGPAGSGGARSTSVAGAVAEAKKFSESLEGPPSPTPESGAPRTSTTIPSMLTGPARALLEREQRAADQQAFDQQLARSRAATPTAARQREVAQQREESLAEAQRRSEAFRATSGPTASEKELAGLTGAEREQRMYELDVEALGQQAADEARRRRSAATTTAAAPANISSRTRRIIGNPARR